MKTIAKMLWRRKVTVLALVMVLTIVMGGTAIAKPKLLKATLEYMNKTGFTGTVMKIVNNQGGSALELQSNDGKAPLIVKATDTDANGTPNGTPGTATGLSADKLDGKDSSEFATSTAESWHEVDDFYEDFIFCTTPWSNFDTTSLNGAGFYKDRGIVHLKGTIQAGSQQCPVFYLPEGYRPAKREIQTVYALDNNFSISTGAVTIAPDGEVKVGTSDGASYQISLDGVTFREGGGSFEGT